MHIVLKWGYAREFISDDWKTTLKDLQNLRITLFFCKFLKNPEPLPVLVSLYKYKGESLFTMAAKYKCFEKSIIQNN